MRGGRRGGRGGTPSSARAETPPSLCNGLDKLVNNAGKSPEELHPVCSHCLMREESLSKMMAREKAGSDIRLGDGGGKRKRWI